MESQMLLQAIREAEQNILSAIAGSQLTDREIGEAARRWWQNRQVSEGATGWSD